jgi:hypothetical protein
VCRAKLSNLTLGSLENSPPNIRTVLHTITPSGMHRIPRWAMGSLHEALVNKIVLVNFSLITAESQKFLIGARLITQFAGMCCVAANQKGTENEERKISHRFVT